MQSTSKPCRICGCLDGEPGLCHALTTTGRACYRVAPHTDWCSACGTWDKTLTINFPTMPIEAKAAHHRAGRAWAAGVKRGGLPGGYALRVHSVRMRRKANQICAAAGLIQAVEQKQVEGRDLPLCPPASA